MAQAEIQPKDVLKERLVDKIGAIGRARVVAPMSDSHTKEMVELAELIVKQPGALALLEELQNPKKV